MPLDPHLVAVLRAHRTASGRIAGLVFPSNAGTLRDHGTSGARTAPP